MIALYPGTCATCDRSISPGDNITTEYKTDSPWIHSHCRTTSPHLDTCRLCHDYIFPGQRRTPHRLHPGEFVHAPRCHPPRHNQPSNLVPTLLAVAPAPTH